MTDLILYCCAAICFFLFSWMFVVSILEKERLATKKSLFLAVIFPTLFISFSLLDSYFEILLIGFLSLATCILLISFLFSGTKKLLPVKLNNFQIDERDTMFSRNEIKNSEEKLTAYYSNNSDKYKVDTEWHKKPGLMNPKATMYNALAFAAADASFYTIEELRQSVLPKVALNKVKTDQKKVSEFIENWSYKIGAVNFGICELKPYHFYSHRGRGEAYGQPVKNQHKYGIAITVEMNKDFLATGPSAPTLMESAQQYLSSGTIAIQIAKFIANLGYTARAHIDGNYEVICPLVARDAGIGDIGRMGLLMTPNLGPRIRIGIVTTDLPLQSSASSSDLSMQDFCTICKKCATVCPSQAIPKQNKQEINGSQRWQINQEKCFSYWCTTGTDCGRCMSVCPYSHPDNLLHNIVRWGIKRSWLFRRIALWLDDFIYGRKPKPAKIPKWI